MVGTENSPDLSLDELMALAADGDRSSAEIFLSRFINEALFVVNRQQSAQLSDQPDYPNEFVSILAVKDQDRAVIPVFTRSELIEDWCGSKLEFRSLSGQRLLSIVPDDWWLSLNPGTELEKEFSPWEIIQLKGGPRNFAAIIEELYADEGPTQLTVEAFADGEFTNLISALTQATAQLPEVLKLYALKEGDKELGHTNILIGALRNKTTPSRHDEILTILKSVADLAQIGAEPVKVVVGDNLDQSPQLGIFKLLKPFFERTPTNNRSGLLGLKRFFQS